MGIDGLDAGLRGLSIDTARAWGLYISTSRGKTSLGIEEPVRFAEPGLFLVRPDGTLYAGAVAAALPDARIVVDRFHVAVQYREAFDDLRKAECQRLNAARSPERAVPTAQLRPLLRREWRSLNPDQQGRLVELFELTPTLAGAYVLRLRPVHPVDSDLRP